jgi:hypothetical protein
MSIRCPALYCIAVALKVHCTALHCTALHCTAPLSDRAQVLACWALGRWSPKYRTVLTLNDTYESKVWECRIWGLGIGSLNWGMKGFIETQDIYNLHDFFKTENKKSCFRVIFVVFFNQFRGKTQRMVSKFPMFFLIISYCNLRSPYFLCTWICHVLYWAPIKKAITS